MIPSALAPPIRLVHFWRAASALLLATVGCGSASTVSTTLVAAPGKPNVLIVVMDTTRADRCSVNGYSRPTTPNLEKIASEGAVYLDAWSPSSWTGPSHASLFTGLRPPNHGYMGGNRLYLDDRATTLAEVLGESGYATACFTNNEFVTPTYGLTQGFQTIVLAFENRALGEVRSGWTHENAAEWAVAKHRAGKPFFLFVNDMEPHIPYVPPEPFAQRFLSPQLSSADVAAGRAWSGLDCLGHILGVKKAPAPVLAAISDLYDAEIATLDSTFPQLLQPLAAVGALDNTIVVIVGDHGENLGEHELLDHKWSLHRTLLHVPLVIRYPPKIRPGTRVDDVVRLEDVAPTVWELTGNPPPEGVLDGQSLLHPTSGRVARGSFGTTMHFKDELVKLFPTADHGLLAVAIRSIYDGRHHYIRYSDGREELYDVDKDPLESRDLSLEAPDVLAALRVTMDQAK